MVAIWLAFTEHVKIEGINFIPNVLVIKEELCDIA